VAAPHPAFSSIKSSGTNLLVSGSNGVRNANYYILASPDLTVPLSNWARLATNEFDPGGGFAFTNAINAGLPAQFFRLQLP